MTESPEPSPPERWYQFSLARLLLLMTLLSVLVASWAGLTRAGGSTPLGIYVLTMAAPLAGVVLLSLWQALLRFWERREP